MVHADNSMVSVEWVFLLIIFMLVYLLFLLKTENKKEATQTSNKRIKEIMAKGGYIVKGEDGSGNLMFEKVCHVSDSLPERGRT